MKKVIVISTSLRARSNSALLASAFAKGAVEAGCDVEILTLKGKRLAYCTGCLACQKTGHCVIKDDAALFVEKVKDADAVVFASPVYYYSISGQLKTLLDRLNPLFAGEYRFRDVYFLSAAAEDSEEAAEGPKTAVQGWVDCFEKARLAGTVFAGGCGDPGSVSGTDAEKKAYELGLSLGA